MATNTVDTRLVHDSGFSFARFADRWIWVFMAVLLIAIALSGFVPSSIRRIHAVELNQSPPFPWFLHIHAVVMGSWLLLLLAQAALIGTGQRRRHMALGVASVVMAPLVFAMLGVLASRYFAQIWASPAEAPLAGVSGRFAFVLTVQARAIVMFAVCYIWAFRTRLTKPDTHKRMMVLATWAMVDAAIARIHGSGALGTALGLKAIGLTSGDDIFNFWMIVTLLPVLLYDLIRHRRLHYAWVAGLAMFLAFAVAAHYLEAAPMWWQQLVAGITGRS